MCLDTPECQGNVVVVAEMSGLPGVGGKKFIQSKGREHLAPQMNFAAKKGDPGGEVFQPELFQVEKGKPHSVFNFFKINFTSLLIETICIHVDFNIRI